jgi:hypothetical protein
VIFKSEFGFCSGANSCGGDFIQHFLVPDESNAVRLDLQNGWSHYGGDYGKAKYVPRQSK